MVYLEVLKKILMRAGEILIELQSNIKSEIKSDNTWLTDADIKIEEFLKHELSKIEAEATFLGEESQDAESCLMWVVDPIDGTKAYKQKIMDVFLPRISMVLLNGGVLFSLLVFYR